MPCVSARVRLHHAALAGLVASACRYPATGVEVGVASDIPPARLLGLTARVTQAGRHAELTPGDDASIALPASFAVLPALGAGADAPAELTIEAAVAPTRPGAEPVTVRRVVRFAFLPRATLRLPVFLTLRCAAPAVGCAQQADPVACTVGALCEERGQTCSGDGTCVSTAVAPEPAAATPSNHWVSAIDPPDASAPDAPVATACVLRDDFEATAQPAYWHTFDSTPPVAMLARAGGHLVIAPAPAAAEVRYAGYYTDNGLDLRDGHIAIEAVQTTNLAAHTAEMLFELHDSRMVVRVGISNGVFQMLVWDNDHRTMADNVTLPYDPVAFRHWQIRGDGATQVVWETSPDGAHWTEHRRMPTPLDLSNTSVVITAGTWAADPNPGTAVFDNVQIAARCR